MDVQKLKKIALLGLERSPLEADSFEELKDLGIEVTGDTAHDVLSGLAALYLFEKTAAELPPIQEKPLAPLEKERDTTPITEDAFHDFEVLAAGVYPAALPIFVHTMLSEKLRFPHKKLPLVLDRCAKQRWLYRAVHPILGTRAFWLMAQHDAWRMLLSVDLTKGKKGKPVRPLEEMSETERAKLAWFTEKMLIRLKG